MAGLHLQEWGQGQTGEWEEGIRKAAKDNRIARRCVQQWRSRVLLGGPARAAALRLLQASQRDIVNDLPTRSD